MYLSFRHEVTFARIRGGGILLQKVFEGEFIHVMAYVENFTTYSSHRNVVKFVFRTKSKCSKCIASKVLFFE